MLYYIIDKEGLYDYYITHREKDPNILQNLTWSNKFILKYDDKDSLIPGSAIPEVIFTSLVDPGMKKVGRLDMLTTVNDGVLGNEVVFTDNNRKNNDERVISLDERSFINIALSIVAYLMEFDGVNLDKLEKE